MKHLMIDLETIGVSPPCPILSVGAVFFDPHMGELGDSFYGVAEMHQSRWGLFPEAQTMAWWDGQSAEARAVFTDPTAKPLDDVLRDFAAWGGDWSDILVYGNGADFDLPIIGAAMRATGLTKPWRPYNGRCYRTLKNLAPHIKIQRTPGSHHNALADALAQAKHLMDIVRNTTLTLG